ncbi:MAG: peptidase [Myxococcales bacterium]|nr:peptidase [Myxococcales bacterium]
MAAESSEPRARRLLSAESRRLPVKKRQALPLFLALLVAGTAGAYVPLPSNAARSRHASETRDADPRFVLDSSADFDRLLARADEHERVLDAELAPMADKLILLKKRMTARGRQYFRLVRAGMLPVGGGFDALVDHANTVERTRTALISDITEAREIRERQATLTKELRRVRVEKAPLLIQREAMRRARAAMQEADERRDAFTRAFGDRAVGHLAVYGADTGPLTGDPLASFTSMRGRLSFPLAGRAEVTPGVTREARSISLRAARDTIVRAVHGGTVVFAGENDGALTAVVDHGDRYFSVYGALQRLDAKVGDVLPERGRIGRIERRADQPATLHFELRFGHNLLDPVPWLGL